MKDLKTGKVLIIDDEIDICYLLNSLLQQSNFFSKYVTTIAEATRELQTDIPALLLLDNHLGDGNGIDFTRYVKEHYPSVKIIMITAYDDAREKEKAFNAGVNDFISKPFTGRVIIAAVQNMLNDHAV